MGMEAKLALLRKQHGLTQLELAEKLNVSRQAISRWEVGAAVPSTENLKTLSVLYGVSVDDILNGEAEAVSQNIERTNEFSKEQNNHSKNSKSMFVFACVLVSLALVAIIMSGVVKYYDREKTTNLPMENMTSEEDDGVADIFSFE